MKVCKLVLFLFTILFFGSQEMIAQKKNNDKKNTVSVKSENKPSQNKKDEFSVPRARTMSEKKEAKRQRQQKIDEIIARNKLKEEKKKRNKEEKDDDNK